MMWKMMKMKTMKDEDDDDDYDGGRRSGGGMLSHPRITLTPMHTFITSKSPSEAVFILLEVLLKPGSP